MEPAVVGRGEETAVALGLLARHVGLLVEGEAGAGKSRLLRALAGRAEHDGWCVVPLAAGAAIRSVPFGAVAHLLPRPLGTDPLRLLQQAHRALVLRAAKARLLIVVDDAHLLDDGSAGSSSRSMPTAGWNSWRAPAWPPAPRRAGELGCGPPIRCTA